jgi:WD40 repeat protein
MKLLRVFADHEDDVEAVSIHPSKPLIATASRDGKARIFMFDGTLVASMVGHKADVISVEWAVDGHSVITSSDDGTVKRWDATNGILLENIDLDGVETDTVVINSHGFVFAGNDLGQIIVICDKIQRKFLAHDSGVKRLVYNDRESLLISLSYDRRVKIWSVSPEGNLSVIATSTLPPEVWPRSCAFINGETIAFATFGSTYATLALKNLIWNTSAVDPTPGINSILPTERGVFSVGDAGYVYRDGKLIQKVPSLCNVICSIGERILTGGQTGQIFDAETGEQIHLHHSPINCATSFLRNGEPCAVFGTYTGEGIVLVERSNGRIEYEKAIKLHNNAIKGLAADERSLMSVCATGALALHENKNFTEILRYNKAHEKIANGCAVVGEACFASISRDLKLRIWTEGNCAEIDSPHTFSIKCIAAKKGGDIIATGSYGGHIAFFQISIMRWLDVIRPSACGISSLAWDEGREAFLASAYDCRIYEIKPTQNFVSRLA